MLDPAQTSFDPIGYPHPSRICAVIVTFNIGVALHRCVDAVKNQVAHVLIIDNGSDEITQLELQKLTALDFATLILNDRNEGLARAYNQAVQWARGREFEWILTLDHDSVATPGMVETLLRGYDALRRDGIGNVGIMAASPFDENSQQFLEYTFRAEGRSSCNNSGNASRSPHFVRDLEKPGALAYKRSDPNKPVKRRTGYTARVQFLRNSS